VLLIWRRFLRATDVRHSDMLACAVVRSFLTPVRTNAWLRLPCFSIDARYQRGAAHQKGAISTIRAPSRTPEIAFLAACRVFDPPLVLCWSSLRHRKQNAVTRRHTQGETAMTSPFKHENVIKIAGVLDVAPELRLTANGNSVATLIVYTNYNLRNEDGSTRQESERHRVVVWGLHAEKAARLLKKGSKVRVQGRMTYPTWKDKQSGATRYGAEIVAQTLDYQGANEEDAAQIAQPAVEAPAKEPAKLIATADVPAKPKRSRSKKVQAAAA
jgi:single-strand DNA-binding protein